MGEAEELGGGFAGGIVGGKRRRDEETERRSGGTEEWRSGRVAKWRRGEGARACAGASVGAGRRVSGVSEAEELGGGFASALVGGDLPSWDAVGVLGC